MVFSSTAYSGTSHETDARLLAFSYAAPFTTLGHFYSRDSKLMGEIIMKTKESQSYLLYNV